MDVVSFPQYDTPSHNAGMTTPLYNSLSPIGQARFPRTLVLTLSGVTVAYVVFGIVPYLYFAGVLVSYVPDVHIEHKLSHSSSINAAFA